MSRSSARASGSPRPAAPSTGVTTAADALAAATPYLPADATHDTTTAVFGQAVESGWVLDDGDRVELLRPLLADPKQARRERAGHHRRT